MPKSTPAKMDEKQGVIADRNNRGQFAKGNKGGPGRPRGERDYIEAMLGKCDTDRWADITDKMLTKASNGDVRAYQVLAPYFVGLPVQKLQLSTAEAAQLAELLELVRKAGRSPSVIFQSMAAIFLEVAAGDDSN